MTTDRAHSIMAAYFHAHSTPDKRWHTGTQPFKNEREKGETHYAIFDEHSACVAHVFSAEDAELMAAAPELRRELAALRESLDAVTAERDAIKADADQTMLKDTHHYCQRRANTLHEAFKRVEAERDEARAVLAKSMANRITEKAAQAAVERDLATQTEALGVAQAAAEQLEAQLAERDAMVERLTGRCSALRECVEMAETLFAVINTYAKDVTDDARAANEKLLAKFRTALAEPDAAVAERDERIAADAVAADRKKDDRVDLWVRSLLAQSAPPSPRDPLAAPNEEKP